MHAGAEVVRNVECDDLGPRPRLEVVQLAVGDVAAVHDDVDVPIRSTLLVPEPDRVSDLVRYRTVLSCTSGMHAFIQAPLSR